MHLGGQNGTDMLTRTFGPISLSIFLLKTSDHNQKLWIIFVKFMVNDPAN